MALEVSPVTNTLDRVTAIAFGWSSGGDPLPGHEDLRRDGADGDRSPLVGRSVVVPHRPEPRPGGGIVGDGRTVLARRKGAAGAGYEDPGAIATHRDRARTSALGAGGVVAP